jgi:hypothetical protein
VSHVADVNLSKSSADWLRSPVGRGLRAEHSVTIVLESMPLPLA